MTNELDGPPRITAVIPTYQRAHLVGRAIESILAQSTPPEQIIVVDDGSTDGTAEVIAAFGDRVSYHRQDNAGGAAARNRGVDLASTEWVAFLDSDDVWLPHHLADITAAMDATDEAADLYFSDVGRTEEEGGGTTFQRAGLDLAEGFELRLDARSWAVAPVQPAMLQGLVVRRRAFREIGGFWPQLSSRHDTHFFYFAFASHSACAVAGVSAQMSADDDVANRLTGGKGNQGRRFWSCSCDLYADIHRRRSDPRERVIARNLWARALKRRARWEWADGERLTALRSGLRALVVSPAAVVASSLPGHPKVPWVQRARRSLGA